MGQTGENLVCGRRCLAVVTIVCLTSITCSTCSGPNRTGQHGSSREVAESEPLLDPGRYSSDAAIVMVLTVLLGSDLSDLTAERRDSWHDRITQFAAYGKPHSHQLRRISPDQFLERIAQQPDLCGLIDDESGELIAVIGSVQFEDELHLQVLNGANHCDLLPAGQLDSRQFAGVWVSEQAAKREIRLQVGETVAQVDKLWHNFGVTKPSRQLAATLTLRNVGRAPIVLGASDASCGCLDVTDLTGVTLAPGESREIQVSVTTGRGTSFYHTVAIPLFQHGTARTRRVTFRIYGNQHRAMEVVPDSLDFGVVGDSTRNISRKIRLSEVHTDRFQVRSVDVGSLPLWHVVKGQDRDDGLHDYLVTLTLQTSLLAMGDSHREIVIHTSSAQFPRVVVPVAWRVPRPFRAIPTSVAYGAVRIGETVERQVQILAEQGFANLRVECDSPPDDCRVLLDEIQSDGKLVLQFTPSTAGIVEHPVVLHVDDGQSIHEIRIDCVALVLPNR